MARIARKKWAEMRAAYRRGEGSLRELAVRFGVHHNTIERRSAKEHWERERRQTAGKAQAKAAEADVESLAAMLGKHRALSSMSLRLAALRLRQLEALGAMNPEAVSVGQLDDLTKVVARMVPVERLAAGVDRIKPVKPVELTDDDEIVFEIDAPPDEAPAPAAAPVKK